MRIGTAEENSTFLTQGQAIQALCKEAGIGTDVEVVVSPFASTQNASRLAAGEIEFGFMASNWIGRALKAEAPFKEKIDLRMVAPMNVGPLYFITRSRVRPSDGQGYEGQTGFGRPCAKRYDPACPCHLWRARHEL